ncbi:MAG: hypothetical protein WC849_00975 [Candidatus Paceibacterota bacterium]
MKKVGTKHVNDDKDESFNRSKGRDKDEKPSEKVNKPTREKNVGIKEEHSKTQKGNRG